MSDDLLQAFLTRKINGQFSAPRGPAGFTPQLPPTDTEEELLEEPEPDAKHALLGEHLIITYVNAKGEDSRRRIAVHLAFERDGTHYLRAFCYERQALRTFRSDRIREIVDGATGEVIDSPRVIVDIIAEHVRPQDGRGATEIVFQTQKQAILILLYLARCDGLIHAAEHEVLLGYIDHCCVAHGIDEDYAATRLARLAPDPKSYERAINYLARFNPSELRRVARSARRLIDADGAVSEAEAVFGAQLSKGLKEDP